jgi:hypothetical protein
MPQTYGHLLKIDQSNLSKSAKYYPKVSKGAINQRLKFLVESLSTSVRAFSEAIGDSSSNTNNYIGSRQTEPKPEYLAKVINHFSNVDAHWLLTGVGEPFKGNGPSAQNQTNISGKKNAVNVVGNNHGTATQNNYTVADCEKERDAYKAERDQARQQVEHLQAQLATKDALIASKEETLTVLKAAFNRPN